MTLVDMSGSTVTAATAAGGTAAGLHAMANTPLGPTLSLAFFVQNMVMLPATNELTPDNVQGGVGGFTEVARLDFLPSFGEPEVVEVSFRSRRLSSETSPETTGESESVPRGLDYLGFRSTSFWTNIGSVARLIIAGYALLVLVYGFCRLLPVCCESLANSPCYRKYLGKYRDLLFWNGVIYLLMLGTNVILTAAFITLSSNGSEGTDKMRIINLLLAVGACALYAGFVLSSIYLFRKYREVLDEWPFLRTYGALSKNLRKSSSWPLSYILVFVLRRALLVLILIWSNIAISLYGILLV